MYPRREVVDLDLEAGDVGGGRNVDQLAQVIASVAGHVVPLIIDVRLLDGCPETPHLRWVCVCRCDILVSKHVASYIVDG